MITVHGIPLTFQPVDDDKALIYGEECINYIQLKQRWVQTLEKSSTFLKAIPNIVSIEFGTLAHFYWKDADVKFKCDFTQRTTTISRCEDGCPDWLAEDNTCPHLGKAKYLEKQPATKDIALDSMHIMRVTLKVAQSN